MRLGLGRPTAVETKIQIRPARAAADACLAMAALERQSPTAAHWAESFYCGLFEEGAAERISLVAEDEAKLAGFLIARVTGDECELENLVVVEGSQRRGLGSRADLCACGTRSRAWRHTHFSRGPGIQHGSACVFMRSAVFRSTDAGSRTTAIRRKMRCSIPGCLKDEYCDCPDSCAYVNHYSCVTCR